MKQGSSNAIDRKVPAQAEATKMMKMRKGPYLVGCEGGGRGRARRRQGVLGTHTSMAAGPVCAAVVAGDCACAHVASSGTASSTSSSMFEKRCAKLEWRHTDEKMRHHWPAAMDGA